MWLVFVSLADVRLAKPVCFNRLVNCAIAALRSNIIVQADSILWWLRLSLWNTVYLELAIGSLRQQGRQIVDGFTSGARPLEPHQPDRRLLVAAKQTHRERLLPAAQKRQPNLRVLYFPFRQTTPFCGLVQRFF
jgi:hypothetical protein